MSMKESVVVSGRVVLPVRKALAERAEAEDCTVSALVARVLTRAAIRWTKKEARQDG